MLSASDAGAGDGFGHSVGTSGDSVVVGAPRDDDAGNTSGSAYVFMRNQNNWGQVDKLTASDAAGSDSFGSSVGISGETVVVGAPSDDDGGSNSGSVYLFQYNQGEADNWVQVSKLSAFDGDPHDGFGSSVSIDGHSVVVGAVVDDEAGDRAGSAYVFEGSQGGTGSWGQVNKLTASDAAADDLFGISVGISDGTLVVGARDDDDAGVSSGSAYIFVEVEAPLTNSTSSWIFQGTAQGGEVAASINDCLVSFTTVAGQSAFTIATNFAASVNANDCLKTQGILGQAIGNEVAITGASISIIDFDITDPGLQHFTPLLSGLFCEV